MSAHPTEALSAYLDGELTPQDRAGVEMHLRQCASCAQHVEELAAVDALARSVPVDAPAGYFEGLPGRVVRRLPARTPRVRTVPAWTWALAAGLVVGLAAPLVVVQQYRAAEAPPVAAPAPTPHADGPTLAEQAATPAPAPLTVPARPPADLASREDSVSQDRLRSSGDVSASPAAPRAEGGLLQDTPGDERAKERDRGSDSAAEAFRREPARGDPRAEPTAVLQETASGRAAAPAAPAPPPARPVPRPAAAAVPGMVAGAPAPADKEALPQPTEAAEERLQARAREALAPAKKAEAERKEAQKRADSNRGGMAVGGRRLAGPAEVQFEALSARVATSVDEARALREAWRNYTRQHPQESSADEARVRLVEAGAEVYRRSQDPADLAVLREDARAYLEDGEAPQAPRVRKALLGLPPEP